MQAFPRVGCGALQGSLWRRYPVAERGVADGSFMQFVVTYSVPSDGLRSISYIKLDSLYPPPMPVDPMAKLASGYTDPTYDALKLGTVYFIFPYDASIDDSLDDTRTP